MFGGEIEASTGCGWPFHCSRPFVITSLDNPSWVWVSPRQGTTDQFIFSIERLTLLMMTDWQYLMYPWGMDSRVHNFSPLL